MSVQLNSSHLKNLVLASAAVVGGVVLKNSAGQAKESSFPKYPGYTAESFSSHAKSTSSVGMLLFTLGWIGVSYFIGQTQLTREKKLMTYASGFAIWFSAGLMRQKMDLGETPSPLLPLAFTAGWLIMGYNAGKEHNTMLGIFAALLVLASMMMLLPWQRKNCIVDGPGMPFFVGAWAILIYINSVVKVCP